MNECTKDAEISKTIIRFKYIDRVKSKTKNRVIPLRFAKRRLETEQRLPKEDAPRTQLVCEFLQMVRDA